MGELIYLMMAWIAERTDYPAPVTQPNVVIIERANLCAQYGIQTPTECGSLKLAGFFNEEQTIYLRGDFDPDEPAHQAWLLHELVHYLQWEAGAQDDCRGALEVEAYELQDAWREQHGLAAASDAFTLFMLGMACSA